MPRKFESLTAAALLGLAPLPALAVTGHVEDAFVYNPVSFDAPVDFLTAPGRTPFGTVDIAVNFTNPVSGAVQAVFDEAETFWEKRIIGYESSALADFVTNNFPQITIDSDISFIDGVGGVLGSAGSTGQISNGGGAAPPDVNNVMVSFQGVMNFDSDDVSNLLAAGTFGDVVRHEMAHVLGFSDFFWDYVAATDGSGSDTTYTGPIALSTYQDEFDPTATFIPVEDEGGPGTAFAHWDEQLFDNFDPTAPVAGATGNPELMTGYLENETYLSRTTLASFDDLGYVTTPVPVPLPALLLLTGMGALGWAARRRRAA